MTLNPVAAITLSFLFVTLTLILITYQSVKLRQIVNELGRLKTAEGEKVIKSTTLAIFETASALAPMITAEDRQAFVADLRGQVDGQDEIDLKTVFNLSMIAALTEETDLGSFMSDSLKDKVMKGE